MLRSRFLMASVVAPSLYLASACGGHSANHELPGACAHYIRAMLTGTCGPTLPDAEIERIQARFDKGCREAIALDGSGVTEATLETCATALDWRCSYEKVPA